MALTPTEAAILDLADEGLSPGEIAARGFSPMKAKFTVSTFGTSRSNQASDSRRERAIRRGSQQLLQALIATGAE